MAMQQFHPSGTRIAGRYEITGAPLIGGMGIVYLCFDHEVQRPVALKTFRPEYLPDRAARDRFLQEGDTWVRLGQHSHIVRCYRVMRDGPGLGIYLILELVAREEKRRDASLRAWLTPGHPLPVDQALLIALQIARGMNHATKTIPGFVHRDLKPENVLVGTDRLSNAPFNRVRVTDFGLVKGLRAEQMTAPISGDLVLQPGRLMQMGAVVGTPTYMAPEQWENTDVTSQTDIYALGCILGEMLTGRILVQGQTLSSLWRAHQDGQALLSARDGVPTVLFELLARCLATKLGQRYSNWMTVEAALATAYGRVTGRPPPEEETSSALGRAERVAAGWSFSEISSSYLEMGDAQAARAYSERAQEAGRAEGERQLEATATNHLGLAHFQLGDARRAVECHEGVLALSRETCAASPKGSPMWTAGRHGEGTALANLAQMHMILGNPQQAAGCYDQAMAIWREICSLFTKSSPEWNLGRMGEGNTLLSMGLLSGRLNNARQALGYYEQALIISREIGDRLGESNALGNLGGAYLALNNAHDAIEYLEQALGSCREIGDRRGEGTCTTNLGIAYAQLGNVHQAIQYYEQGLIAARELLDRRGQSLALVNLGDAYKELGDFGRAIEFYEQSLAMYREIGDRHGESITLQNLGEAYRKYGDLARALRHFEQAFLVSQHGSDVEGAAMSLLGMTLIYKERGNMADALTLGREACRLFGHIGSAKYTEYSQRLVTELEIVSLGGRDGILREATPLIDAVISAAYGDKTARIQMENLFGTFTQEGWRLADSIRRIWAGERDEGVLTADLGEYRTLIVREILRRL